MRVLGTLGQRQRVQPEPASYDVFDETGSRQAIDRLTCAVETNDVAGFQNCFDPRGPLGEISTGDDKAKALMADLRESGFKLGEATGWGDSGILFEVDYPRICDGVTLEPTRTRRLAIG